MAAPGARWPSRYSVCAAAGADGDGVRRGCASDVAVTTHPTICSRRGHRLRSRSEPDLRRYDDLVVRGLDAGLIELLAIVAGLELHLVAAQVVVEADLDVRALVVAAEVRRRDHRRIDVGVGVGIVVAD